MNLLRVKVSFSPVIELTQIIKECGYFPSVKTLNVSEFDLEDDNIAEKLELSKREKMISVEKIFFADKSPCVYTIDIFSKSILQGKDPIDAFKFNKSVYEVIFESYNRQILWDKVDISSVNASQIPNYKKYLSNDFEKEKPLLLLKGLNFDNEDKPIMITYEYIDTDFIKFSLIRQRKIQYLK